jgi:hypothetical protein
VANVLIVNSDRDVPRLARLWIVTRGLDDATARAAFPDIAHLDADEHGVEFVDTHCAGLARVGSDTPHPVDVAFVEWGPSVSRRGTDVASPAEVLDAYVAAGHRLGVRIVILPTYKGDEELNATVLSRGASGLMTIPFSPETLWQELDRALLG